MSADRPEGWSPYGPRTGATRVLTVSFIFVHVQIPGFADYIYRTPCLAMTPEGCVAWLNRLAVESNSGALHTLSSKEEFDKMYRRENVA